MKKLTTLFLLLTLIACGPAAITTPTVTPSPSSTPAPMATNTSAPMATSAPEFGDLVQFCAEILPAVPEGRFSMGTLVVKSYGEGLTLLNFDQKTQRTIPGFFTDVSTSPNGKWLSYLSDSPTHNGSDLILESADEQKRVHLEDDWWNFGPITWLNNKQVLFLTDDEFGAGPQTIAFNPFTGEQQVLYPDFPDFAPFYGSGSLPLYFNTTNVIYDPMLKYAVYPQDADDGYYFALRNLETGQTVAKVLSNGLYEPPPLWLSRGDAFVVAAFPDKDSPREWFMVSRDGKVRQLTNFKDLFPAYEISSHASLLFEGYLVFGLSHGETPSQVGPMELFMLSLYSLDIYNYCIPFDDQLNPVWSPFGPYGAIRFLAVRYLDPNKKYPSIVVLDIESGWAANVFSDDKEDRIPIGWFSGK